MIICVYLTAASIKKQNKTITEKNPQNRTETNQKLNKLGLCNDSSIATGGSLQRHPSGTFFL